MKMPADAGRKTISFPTLAVLVHAPFGKDGELIARVLEHADIKVQRCDGLHEVYEHIQRGPGAVLLADEALNKRIVHDFATHLRNQPPWSDLPVIVMTTGGEADEGSWYRLRLLESLGNVTLLERPLRKATLLSAVSSALRARARQYEIRNYIQQNEQSLQEKEVLLREIHHRVKNNLQVISCLLNMQASAVQEPTALAALLESERRVLAMALIHERLYGHNRLDRVNFGEYAEGLITDLWNSYVSDNADVGKELSLDPIELHIEQAIPCGLILNELITNCLKYAHPKGSPACISVDFHHTEDQRILLSVRDNGPGLPEGFETKRTNSLGLTVVKLLTKQLQGSLEIESSTAGATFTILFPKATCNVAALVGESPNAVANAS